jgi:methionyl-tRNA formyltransferase
MRIVFLGTGDFGVPALRRLREAGHELLAAISQPDRPARRGLKTAPTPIHTAADELGIRHIQAEDVNALSGEALFGDADIGVVVAFGQKIGPEILRALRRGCVNIHASLLPAYRGAAPFQWAILNGETTTGVTVFQLNDRWDAGDIWATSETAIGETETASELHDRLAIVGAATIIDALTAIERGDSPRPQDPARASRAPKLSRADSAIDWTQPARIIVRRILGLWSWPTAVCEYVSQTARAERLQLARAKLIDDETPQTDRCPAGTVREDMTVQAGVGVLQILEVKPAGGKLMPFDAFTNGRHTVPGDFFRTIECT